MSAVTWIIIIEYKNYDSVFEEQLYDIMMRPSSGGFSLHSNVRDLSWTFSQKSTAEGKIVKLKKYSRITSIILQKAQDDDVLEEVVIK